jgi:hypothetical protein
VPYGLHLWVHEGRLTGEIVSRISDGPFARATKPISHRADYIVTLMRMALSGSLKRLMRCIVCDRFKLMPRARPHAFCSRACGRKHDAQTKRPSTLEKALATLPREFQNELQSGKNWPKLNQDAKLRVISYFQAYGRIYRM